MDDAQRKNDDRVTMRVLLAHKLWNVTGGAEVFFHETARVLREHGHTVFSVCSGNPAEAPAETRLLEAPEYDDIGFMRKIKNLPSAIYDRRKKADMAEIIEAFRPDIVHVFDFHIHLTPSILVAASEAHVPVVLTCNDYRHICPNYKLYHHEHICLDCKGGKFSWAIRNRCCKDRLGLSIASAAAAYVHEAMHIYDRCVDLFTFSSDFMARTTQEFWADRSFVWRKLRNPFNSAMYAPDPAYLDYGLYFGRIIEEKGVDKLIEAASSIDGFPIKIVGTGPDEAKLRAVVAERGLSNVEFLGPKWGDELDVVLKKARFVAVPSLWHENFPYVINQAFAYARPVIGSRRGGITELVEHNVRGLLYEATDAGELAAKIKVLAQAPDMAVRMGKAAKSFSDEIFDDRVFYAALIEAYQGAGDARSRPRR